VSLVAVLRDGLENGLTPVDEIPKDGVARAPRSTPPA
jgi:hypothetical protein